MSEPGPESPQSYRIGAVSRLTGIPTDTIRVWERRYRAVEPMRSESGTRLYGAAEIGRLTLIKRLVDGGDAIGSVARLGLDQLRARLCGSDVPAGPARPDRPLRVAVLGRALAERLGPDWGGGEGLAPAGVFDDPASFLAQASAETADLALLWYPALHPDQVPEIGRLLAQSGIERAILVCGFATEATLARLGNRRIIARRAPIGTAELRRLCLAQGQTPSPAALGPAQGDLLAPIPPRRFDDARLGRIAATAPKTHCECPSHLADLVASLAGFEDYCEGCESRHPEDAALLAHLRATTAQARGLMESALARVLDAEGSLPDRSPAPPPNGP